MGYLIYFNANDEANFVAMAKIRDTHPCKTSADALQVQSRSLTWPGNAVLPMLRHNSIVWINSLGNAEKGRKEQREMKCRAKRKRQAGPLNRLGPSGHASRMKKHRTVRNTGKAKC